MALQKPQRMALTRRRLLLAGAAGGAVLLTNPTGALARYAGTSPITAARRKTKAMRGLTLVHADLHNHTLLSDGKGLAENAFESMRAHGLDVAAITDHSGAGKLQGDSCQGCAQALGIDESEWRRIGALADAAYDEGTFVAMRGFEWSSPTLGHINVWMSQTWTDPVATGGVGPVSAGGFFTHQDSNPMSDEQKRAINETLRVAAVAEPSMAGFYEWLNADPKRPVIGGGADAIAGFNHPGREAGRFSFFQYDPTLRDRIVSIEMFNRGEDYLFEATHQAPSPLVECLDKGWRVGILGVTDEHGTNWGQPDGKGRAGLWVTDYTRGAVREAMLARRFFATREKGLSLAVTANKQAMGSEVPHNDGLMRFTIALDKGTEWAGLPLRAQVLQSGDPLPTVVHQVDFAAGSGDDEPFEFDAPVSRENGDWVVIRITDPSSPADGRATGAYATDGRAVAYASPFFLVDGPPAFGPPGRGRPPR